MFNLFPKNISCVATADTSARTCGDRVYVIDDDSEIRRSLHFLLSTVGIQSWPFASASDFLDNVPSLMPAPILLDIRMPGIDGIQLMTKLAEIGIEWPVIIMTAHGEIPLAVQAIRLGAIEFLEKPFEFEALDFSLQTAFAQMLAINIDSAKRSSSLARFVLLSPRETEVMNVLMRGMSNKAAAYQLSLSVRTVEMHRANALVKLEVRSLAEVVQLASDARLGPNPAVEDTSHVRH